MSRILVVMSLVLLASTARAEQRGHDACTRDASRFCRSQLGNGDQAVLACLQEHRARLSRACERVLTEHGQ